MKVHCYSCGKALANPGAIIIGPPIKGNRLMSLVTVHKYHICLECWPALENFIENEKQQNSKEEGNHDK